MKKLTDNLVSLLLETKKNIIENYISGILPSAVPEHPVNYQPGIVLEIKDLCKLFPGGKLANNCVNLSVKPGEIFGLLGHNGAGKTTLISQITGMIPPSAGDAYVCGYSISSQMPKVRQNLAFCPQVNPLYASFTLREHIDFFARLRGYTA